MADETGIRVRFDALSRVVDERMRRLLAAAEAQAIGYGGASIVSRVTGVSRRAIRSGVEELKQLQEPGRQVPAEGSRIRKPGGGRKKTVDKDPQLRTDLKKLVEPVARGDPESPLQWTCKSVRRLAQELSKMGHQASHRMVAELLHELGYSLQANRKTLEGGSHPDRNAQFEYLDQKIQAYLASGDPVISVDTKKRELVGEFKNGGREWHRKGQPEPVRMHDFVDPQLGRATPYGVYDLAKNTGWVSVGTDHDTASFAVESIRRWWYSMGQPVYPTAQRLLVTADGGGSNGSRVRLWKLELHNLAKQLGFPISVCHLPPGTSKWNKIEHRLFSFISQNWRGKPLRSHEVIVHLIAATTTKEGLKVRCELDENAYPKGRKVSEEEFKKIKIQRDDFHGDWNYSLLP